MKLPLIVYLLCWTCLLTQAQAQETSPAPPQQPEDARLALKQAAEAAEASASASPQPIPEKLPLITRTSPYGEWHAFCIRLPKGPALVMPTIPSITAPPIFNGSPLKMGSLITKQGGTAGSPSFWVWEMVPGPATVGAPVRRSASLPLLREGDEVVIVTQEGHRKGSLEPDTLSNAELLPGEPSPAHPKILIERDGIESVKCGDPIFHEKTGELIGAITFLYVSAIPTEVPSADILLLDFTRASQSPLPPLTHLWGIPVKPSPTDREIFTRVLPMHVTQDRLGEDLAPVWARNPYLSRRPNSSAAREELPNHFLVENRSVQIKSGRISELHYLSWTPHQKETNMLVRWLVEKFAEPQLFEVPKSQWLMAAWDRKGVTICLEVTSSDSPSLQIYVRSGNIADIVNRLTSAMRPKAGGSSLMLQWIDSIPEPPKEDPIVER
ncbi:MAG: hypothetical protein ACAH88_14235 [Roseimicrobium sp.]